MLLSRVLENKSPLRYNLSMFRPNALCQLSRQSEETTVYGQTKLLAPKETNCAVVWLESQATKTSVRTDSSASRGNAREETIKSRMLFPTYVEIDKGDKVEIYGLALKVESVFPRHNVNGQFDHWQVDLTKWASE